MKSIRIAGRIVKMRVVLMGAGVLCALALLILFSGNNSKPVKKQIPEVVEEKKVDILVAAQDIPEDIMIKSSMVSWEAIYESEASGADIIREKMPNMVNSLTKMRSGQLILAGERLRARYFKPVFGSALAIKVRQGYRAFTFQVDGINSVGGYVTPGDIIDVFYRVELPNYESIPDRRTISIAQKVKVLATDNLWKNEQANEKFGVRKLLTIEVTPEQAGELAAIGNNQGLFVTLRNPLDDRINDVRVLGETSQIVKKALEPVAKPTPKPKIVNVFQRGSRTVYDCTESCKTSEEASVEDTAEQPLYLLQTTPTSSIKSSQNRSLETNDDLMQNLKQRKN